MKHVICIAGILAAAAALVLYFCDIAAVKSENN